MTTQPWKSSTIDGMQYLEANFGGRRDIYFVRNTNDLFLIGFTPETSVHYSLAPDPLYRIPKLRQARKVTAAHKFLYRQAPMWFWKEQFSFPVRLCGGDSPECKWRKVEQRAFNIVQRIESGGNLGDKLVLRFVLIARAFYLFPFRIFHVIRSCWVNRATVARRLVQICRGDRLAFRRVMWRLRESGHQIFGRTIRDSPSKRQ